MNPTTQWVLAVILAIGIVVAAVLYRKFHKRPLPNPVDVFGVPLPETFPINATTPGGIRVASVVPVPDSVLPLLDEGITNQLDRINAAKPEWANYKNLSDYIVLFIEPMATNKETDPGSPAIIVKNGLSYTQAAGTCVGLGNQGTGAPMIVLPHQEATNWSHTDYLMHSVWNESEHVREWTNDQTVFWSFTNAGDIHPHFP